jgi:hypothetical protein
MNKHHNNKNLIEQIKDINSKVNILPEIKQEDFWLIGKGV